MILYVRYNYKVKMKSIQSQKYKKKMKCVANILPTFVIFEHCTLLLLLMILLS